MLKSLALICFLIPLTLFSQTTLVVLDAESGQPISEAYIKINSGYPIISNASGEVHIPTSLNKRLVEISHVSYFNYQDTLQNNAEKITVFLNPKLEQLNTVVLTGELEGVSKNKVVHQTKIISQKQIEQIGGSHAGDVLKFQSGLTVSRDPVLGSSLSINGLSGEHVKIIVDDVELNGRSDGFIDLEQIVIENDQKIEVVKGPLSLQYGSNALGGVVQFVSTDTDIRDSIGVKGVFSAENTGTYRSLIHFVEAKKKHSLNVYFNRTFFDGWKEGDVFWEGFGKEIADSNRFKTWKPKEIINGKVKYDVNLGKLRLTNQASYQVETITTKGYPFLPPTYSIAKDSKTKAKRFYFQSVLKGNFGKNHLFKITANHQNYTRVIDAFTTQLNTLETLNHVENTTKYFSNQIRYQGNVNFDDKHFVHYGFDALLDEISGERIENNKQNQQAYGFFVKDRIEWNKHWTIQPGIRYNYYSNSTSAFSPSLAMLWKNNKQSEVRASISQGFRNPTIKDLYFEFIDNNHHIIGNETLKPENSSHINLDFEHKISKNIRITANGFYNVLNNKIQLVQSVNDANIYTYSNFSKYKGFGGGSEFQLRLKRFQWNTGVQYLSDKVLDRNIPDRWIKSYQISTQIQKDFKNSDRITLAFIWNSEKSFYQFDSSENIIQTIQSAYHFMDLGYHKKISKHLDVSFWVKNIFDVTQIENQNTTAHSSSQQNIDRGRQVQVQLKVRF